MQKIMTVYHTVGQALLVRETTKPKKSKDYIMRLSDLTTENLIVLNSDLTNKNDVITKLVDLLFTNGNISSKEDFKKAIYDREKLSHTGLEQGLAIPHGKSNCVLKAGFAVLTSKNTIADWESLDQDNKVNHVIMLAIPYAEAGNTHLDLLAKLMTKMSNEDFSKRLFSSKTPKEFYDNLDNDTNKKGENINYTKSIVAVTACPAGIAHTYMAAQALINAGDKTGIKVYVEKQGANGTEDKHTKEMLTNAVAAIFAVDVAVKEPKRFAHLPIVKVPVAKPLKDANSLIEEALKKAETFQKTEISQDIDDEDEKETVAQIIKKSVLTGISYMIPIIVAGGMIGAFAVLISNAFGLEDLYSTENSWLWLFRNLASNMLGVILIPVLSAYMAYSIGDKTALASGFAAGVAANIINGGFLSGMAGGLIAGFTVLLIKKYIKPKGHLKGFISFWVYPVLSTVIVSIFMFLIIGPPIAFINTSLINFLNSLGTSNAILLGAIVGIMVSFDLGGPINKAAYAFCIGAMSEGVLVPYAVFASVKMVSGFAITLAVLFGQKYYTQEEVETGKSTWILALAGITEGAIPFMMAAPVRVITSLCVGSAITGAIVAFAGIGLDVPGAGIFSVFMLQGQSGFLGAIIWFGAAVFGAIISAILLHVLKKFSLRKG
ncbi:MAG: PTS 2-O-a-mannosyl-D-glycerate transporter subunit IIABC [Clostridia bacterium]